MKTIKNLAFVLIALLLSTSCDTNNSYFDNRLKVINNSDKTIYAVSYQSYPDTTLGKISVAEKSSNKARPNGIITLGRGGTWETAFKEDIHQKLIVFIFDAAVVDNTPWDTIRNNYLILKRYELTLQDLEKVDWRITYP